MKDGDSLYRESDLRWRDLLETNRLRWWQACWFQIGSAFSGDGCDESAARATGPAGRSRESSQTSSFRHARRCAIDSAPNARSPSTSTRQHPFGALRSIEARSATRKRGIAARNEATSTISPTQAAKARETTQLHGCQHLGPERLGR